MFCSLSYEFFFVGNKKIGDIFKDTITTSIKANYRLKFARYVTTDNVREKGKPRWKISYKVFKYQYGCDPLIDIYMFQILIQLKEFLGGIQHCFTVVGRWIFDSNIPFSLPLTRDDMDYSCTNNNEK